MTKPKQITPPKFVTVDTFDVPGGKLIRTKRIDYNMQGDRDWLPKHLAWAINNGHGVQVSRS